MGGGYSIFAVVGSHQSKAAIQMGTSLLLLSGQLNVRSYECCVSKVTPNIFGVCL